MSILFDSTRPVKTRRNHVFGVGLGLSYDNTRPPVRPYSDEDWAWYCENVSRRSGGVDDDRPSASDLERRAEECRFLDAYEIGVAY
jgi:hypothetical protein